MKVTHDLLDDGTALGPNTMVPTAPRKEYTPAEAWGITYTCEATPAAVGRCRGYVDLSMYRSWTTGGRKPTTMLTSKAAVREWAAIFGFDENQLDLVCSNWHDVFARPSPDERRTGFPLYATVQSPFTTETFQS